MTEHNTPDNEFKHKPWWRHNESENAVTVSDVGTGRLRDRHWSYFEDNVLPCMLRLIRTSFPSDISETLGSRLSNSSRFRASEIMYALLHDLGASEMTAGIWGCAAVEFLLFSRLMQDDIVDQHDYRWGVPTLRKLHGSDKASLIATQLAALAVLSAEVMDRELHLKNPAIERSASATALVADCSRVIADGMLRELRFDSKTISEIDYYGIARDKVSNGRLSGIICAASCTHIDSETALSLIRSVSATDIAASIANDISEADQRRGIDTVRFPQGEQRGDRTEFQLGRPTIFHVFMTSDDYLRVQANPDPIDLSQLAPPELLTTLTTLGAIDYARRKRDYWIRYAFEALPSGFTQLTEWISSAAQINI